MKLPYLELYQELLNEIDKCAQENAAKTEKQFEASFAVSVRYYEKLKRLALQNGFANTQEEIEFFRNIKPRFTAFIEFSVIATEALWFIENSLSCPRQFWKEEMDKYGRFCERHHSFIEYYTTGQTHLDETYFLRATAEATSDFQSQVFDDSCLLDSSKDWILRSYFAHKMYHGFAQEKAAAMDHSNAGRLSPSGLKADGSSADDPSREIQPSFSSRLLRYLVSDHD